MQAHLDRTTSRASNRQETDQGVGSSQIVGVREGGGGLVPI